MWLQGPYYLPSAVPKLSSNLTFQSRWSFSFSLSQVKNAYMVQHRGKRLDLRSHCCFPCVFGFGWLFPLAGSITGLEGGLFFLPFFINSALRASSFSFYSTTFPLGPLKFHSIFPFSKQEEKWQYHFWILWEEPQALVHMVPGRMADTFVHLCNVMKWS